jgi:hypothetical protein
LSRSRTNVGRITAVATILCTTLSGCSDIYYDRRESIALSAGDAQDGNKVVQMVDPWPAESSNRDIAFNGGRMQTAVERYRTNKVIPPTSAMTSSVAYQQAQQAQATTPGRP